MKRFGRWTPLIVLLVFVVGAILYSESLKTRVAIGAEAPTFELDLLEGGVVRSEQYLGTPLLINFWAAWCPPCLEEMPAHHEFYRRYRGRIEYVAVNERETVARIERHLNEVAELGLEMDLPIALDRRGTVGDAFRLGGMPETWLVDAEGVARQHWVGPVGFEELEAAYRAVVGAGPDEPDGGPFHGTADATAVLMTDGAPETVFLGGKGGLARYDLGGKPAPGDGFQWVRREDVRGLMRDDEAPEGVRVWPGVEWSGLPGEPSNAAAGPGGDWLVWTPGHGLFSAANRQGPWRRVGAELPASMPYADPAADPFTPGHWVLATPAGLWGSRDGGATWRDTGFKARTFAAVFDPVAPRRLYVAAQDGVWVSEDDGRTAVRLPGSPQRALVALDVAPDGAGSSVLVAAAPNGDLYAGRDGGRRWDVLVPAPAAP